MAAETLMIGVWAVQFTDVPTEQTTALTDAVLAVVAVWCLTYLRRGLGSDRWKVGLWSWVLGLLAFAAALGTVVHGLALGESLRDRLWQPLYLSLGLVVALFVVAAVYDWRGAVPARRLLPVMIAVGVGFYLLTRVAGGTFVIFVAYEAVAMVFALAIYSTLALGKRLPGAGVVAIAVLLNIVAAAIQSSGSISLTIGVPLDHNGVFHIVQMGAVVVLVRGLRLGLG